MDKPSNIQVRDWRNVLRSVGDAIENECEVSHYDYPGAVENAAEAVRRVSRVLGGLVQLLVDNGTINAEGVNAIVSGIVCDVDGKPISFD